MKEIHRLEEVPDFENEEEGPSFGRPIHSEGRRYSGKVNLRMPKSLHRDLVHDAEREGVSLNQLIVATLAGSMVGKRRWIS